MRSNERIITQCILRPLDVRSGQRVRGVFQPEIDNILWCDPEKTGAGYTKEAIKMRCIARTDFERAVDIGKPVRVTVDKAKYREDGSVRQEPDEAPRRTGWHAAHFNKDAVRCIPEAMIV